MEPKKIRCACPPDISVSSSLPISNNGAKPAANLTSQEKRVLNFVAEALSNKEIAVKLGISPCTVKRHIENILRKLELRNRVEAAIYAVRNGHAMPKPGSNGEVA